MTRRMGAHALALFFLLPLFFLAAGGCSDGELGAVSVRWRLVDLDTSVGYDPKELPQADGACVGPGWVVHNVRLKVNDPDTNAPIPVNPAFVIFTCRQREATTSFHIPLGRFAFDLCPFSADPEICDDGITPAPAIRTVKKAEIINLDVIEIGVNARNLPPTNGDLGTSDAASPI